MDFSISKILEEGEKVVHHKTATKRSLMNVERDWAIIVVASCILLAGLFLFSATTFFKVQRTAGELQEVAAEAPKSVNEERLEQSLSFFDEKIGQYERLRQNTPTLVDPSR